MNIEEIRKGAPKGSQYYIQCSDGIIYFKYRWGRVFKWDKIISKFVLYNPKCSIHDLAKPL